MDKNSKGEHDTLVGQAIERVVLLHFTFRVVKGTASRPGEGI